MTYSTPVRGLGLRVATSGTKSWFIMRRFKGRMLRSTFGRYPDLGSVTKRDLNDLIDKIVQDGSPVAANRVLAFIKRFFSWCRERDILEQSPAETIKPPWSEKNRDRVLTLIEIKSMDRVQPDRVSVGTNFPFAIDRVSEISEAS